ncbi:DNA repair protein RAD16 [Penicillium odoratum]|uniref:DNA repair protein RAD16 n=1 Tax=Penicillium odoratum TaxID=1167516 RepID=UPI0025468FBC|nr:DNA repair protein RAD16 [Penicillium odoratum]KAJ5777077.1 DNA repair protein RAD16 [Penicillium odoratum]
MRTRRSIVPDSEDGFLSATSLKNSSPVRQVPVTGSSHSTSLITRVIKDSEDEGSDTLDLPNPAANNQVTGIVKVVVPAKKYESPTDSSRSSLGVTSADSVTGYNTPATSVGTVTESESRKPRARVNASARAQQLRESKVSRATQRGTKRSAEEITPEAMDRSKLDAALALALQMGEQINNKATPLFEISDSEDLSDLTESPLLDGLSSDPEDSDNWSGHSEAIESDVDEDFDSSMPRRPPNINPPARLSYSDDDQEDEELPPSWEEARKDRRKQADRKKLEKQHPAISTMWDDLKAQSTIAPKQAKQPESINRKLKPFQLEGLNWMMEQEKSSYRGGLLGDEMGMGKTIQAVSLIMSDFPQPNPTLVLVPPVALMQWVSEIKDYTDGKLKVLVHHGSDSKVKKLTPTDLQKYDVIMISYSSLESMYRKQEKGWARAGGFVKEDSVIHSIHYHRLVLDEAHSIKQRTTGVAKACFALQATYKWCLSGTPVQNRIGEFFSLLRFLQVRPFACYFCKQCNCEQLQWTANKQGRCTECNHTGFNHISIFNKEILNPITEGRTQEERKEGLKKLRLITDHIMLRRMKQEHTSSMELPPKRIIIRNEFFGEVEHDFSRSIMSNSTRKFDTYVSQGVMLNNYANIFGLIMQMRQVANHPDLILKKHVQPGFNILVCRVCDEPAEDAIRSRCRHEFCRKCVKDYIHSFDEESTVDCPQCHIPLAIDLEQPTIEQAEESVKKNSIINRILMDNWTSSTKIETLVYELYQQRNKSHTPKSIIFSQFTSMLQLVEWRLRHAGFNTVMLDGTMTPAQRQKSIEHFMNKPDVEVFLVSLKAGGVALNLTEASRVFIVDPWWNPAAEWQSADRSHRIGQQRPCVITRLCIEDSVESRIVQLQEKKANLIRGTINKDQDQALEKLTPEDMQFLFRGS